MRGSNARYKYTLRYRYGMSNTTQTEKIYSRNVDLFLKTDSDFSEESTIKLVKNISSKTHFEDPKTHETVDVTDMDLMEMVNRNLDRVGVSGWHAFDDAFMQCFATNYDDSKFAGDEKTITEVLDEAYSAGQDGGIFSDYADRPIRSISVGDVFKVSECVTPEGHSNSPRFFVVAKAGFVEFKRATGEIIA